MTDIFNRKQRSALMSRVRSKNTQPEVLVRRLLHRMGYRFRLHVAALPGHPDIVLPRHRVIVDVRGCFWHGHRCKKGAPPTTHVGFWHAKISGNRTRDIRNVRLLKQRGWRVIVLWECQLERDTQDGIRRRLLKAIRERTAVSAT